MRNPKDELFHFFENHLFEFEFEECGSGPESESEFVKTVVNKYWDHVQKFGFVSSHHEREILLDLESEVHDMLRKKIYGHFSLKHFREVFNKKPV